jgi:hypothetical protein
MVAYSFNRRFVPAIESGIKSQTIRAPRRRHARPGEWLQLYTGMRTKSCRLIRADVVCSRLDEVRFDLRALADAPMPKNSRQLLSVVDTTDLPLTVNGIPVEGWQKDVFAIHDGFLGWQITGEGAAGISLPPFAAMVLFWMGSHGPSLFEGVMISWEKAPSQAASLLGNSP